MSYMIASGYRKARKKHRCDWCETLILKGSDYYYWTSTFDGIWTGKSHLTCKADMDSCYDCDREELSEYSEERNASKKFRFDNNLLDQIEVREITVEVVYE